MFRSAINVTFTQQENQCFHCPRTSDKAKWARKSIGRLIRSDESRIGLPDFWQTGITLNGIVLERPPNSVNVPQSH
jgi:hypothetical protein